MNRRRCCSAICAWCGRQQDAAGKRHRAPRRCHGRGRATTTCASSWRSVSSPTWSTIPAPSRRSTRCSMCSRRKSGNYTVRRPLEIGAAMAGCTPEVIDALGGYGAAIGEAFQLRDDLLGVFGVTDGDRQIRRHRSGRAQSHQRGRRRPSSGRRRRYGVSSRELMSAEDLSEDDLRRWRALIIASGAVDWIEQLDRCATRPRVGLARHRPAQSRSGPGRTAQTWPSSCTGRAA